MNGRNLIPIAFAGGVAVGNTLWYIDDRWVRAVMLVVLFILINALTSEHAR